MNQMKKTTKLEKERQERKQGRVVREQRMKHRKEMSQLKETMRLENEEQERWWNRKQKQNEFEINELKERAKLASTEMEKLRKDNERLMGLGEEERFQWEGKWSQEVEQDNNVGHVTSPQGGTLVVRDLISIARRMKQQLGRALIKETQITSTDTALTHGAVG